jgi:hypothetical protein
MDTTTAAGMAAIASDHRAAAIAAVFAVRDRGTGAADIRAAVPRTVGARRTAGARPAFRAAHEGAAAGTDDAAGAAAGDAIRRRNT